MVVEDHQHQFSTTGSACSSLNWFGGWRELPFFSLKPVLLLSSGLSRRVPFVGRAYECTGVGPTLAVEGEIQ